MKADTFTGAAKCKARITTRGPAREGDGGTAGVEGESTKGINTK